LHNQFKFKKYTKNTQMKKYKEKKEEINDNPVESDDGFQSFED
jgi:hypothetical protein